MKINKNKIANRIFKLFTFLIVIMSMNSACNKKEATANNNSQIGTTLQGYKWRVSYFLISQTNRTGQFSGYEFTFNIDNTVTARQGGNSSANGTWRITKNANSGGEYLELSFGNQFYFQELNGEWFVNRNDNAIISFENLVGSSGNIDYLTFERL
jgi:hypothetical protein